MSFTRIGSNMTAALSRIMVERISRQAAKGQLALSTGKRINSTMDDASGFTLARGLEARRRGLTQALANINNAESLLNIAAGTYDTISAMVINIKELVLQGADDTFSPAQRNAIQGQIDALVEEIDDTVSTTTFQGTVLIDGSFTGKRFQTGEAAGETTIISLTDVRTSALALAGIDVSSHATASLALTQVDDALLTLQLGMQNTGELIMRFQANKEAKQAQIIGVEAVRSRVEDLDFAEEQMRMSRIRLVQELGFMSMQKAIVAPQQVLSLIAQ